MGVLRQANKWSTKIMEILREVKLVRKNYGGDPKIGQLIKLMGLLTQAKNWSTKMIGVLKQIKLVEKK